MGYVYKKKSLKMTSINIVYKSGAVFEEKGKHGTMHLMEHLICKTYKDLYPLLTKKGISWNAYTDDEIVRVYFIGLSSQFTSDLKEELVKRLTSGLDCISEDEFKTERSVVLQEYFDCAYSPEYANMLNLLRKKYGSYSTIGKKEDIESFTYEDMKATYDMYFRRPFCIVEVGNSKTEYFETVEYDESKRKSKKAKYKEKHRIPLIKIDSFDKIPVYCISKSVVTQGDYPYLSVGLDMLASGLESPLYKELREKRGLTYYVRGCVTEFSNYGILYMDACTDAENADTLKTLYDEILGNAVEYMTRDRFDEVMSSMKLAREKSNILLYSSPNRLFKASGMRFPNNLDKISYEKVVAITKKYLDSRIVLRADELYDK